MGFLSLLMAVFSACAGILAFFIREWKAVMGFVLGWMARGFFHWF